MATDRDILPDTVKPINYYLSLYKLDFQTWTYEGTVKISLETVKPAKKIVLNSNQLRLEVAKFASQVTTNITYDEHNQRATIEFEKEFPASINGELEIHFEGQLNNSMAGFYRSRYKLAASDAGAFAPTDGEYHYMGSTQFESCDARRAFPCFDEPNLKASFEFEIEIPEELVALSNMPEKETKLSVNKGKKHVSFEKSPIMSTYLYAWAFGDFEYVEAFTERKYNGKPIPVRVYTTRGLKEQGQWALQNCHKIVDYFSGIFKIDYPLPKVDLLACHEFSHGAMENWGLITYRTTALLFDPAQSDQMYKQRVAYVVAHELAHQWFGNLVTMDWWSELWLNEGFATWVGWLAIDHLYPEWNTWAQFCAESLHSAFVLDSIRSSHPIEVPVRNALEVDQIFDAISYLKGSSVIRMLTAHLGTETFLTGVSNYLKAHQYKNATTKDLWTALGEASKQDVNTFMDPWIRKIGFPVLTVAEEPGQVTVRQSRFLISGDVEKKDDETIWWIPLGLTTGANAKTSPVTALTVKEDTIRDIDDSFYKFNTGASGFYRTSYPVERLKKLGEQKDKLAMEDKISLIGDAAALAQAGLGTTASFLALIEKFQDESQFRVWSQILSSLNNVRAVFAELPDVAEGLRQFTLKLVTQAVEKIGWKFAEKEDFLTGQLRALLITTAGLSGHEAVAAEAVKQFRAEATINFDSVPDAIHPSLRKGVFRIAVQKLGAPALEKVQKYYANTQSVDGKEIALLAMGQVPTAELAEKVLDFSFTKAVATQDRHSPAAAIANNAGQRAANWDYVKKHWDDKIFPELSANLMIVERWLKVALGNYASLEVEQDIAKFFEGKDCKGFDRGLSVVKDTIVGAAKYKERDAAVVKEWLKANGYIS